MFGRKYVSCKLLGLGILSVTLAACSSSQTAQPAANTPNTDQTLKVNTDPVTLVVAANSSYITDDDFKIYFTDAVKKKYPYITVERIDSGKKGQTVPELVASGSQIDLVFDPALNLSILKGLGLDMNMEELIAKHKFDLNRIQPVILESVKVANYSTYFGSIPVYNNYFGLVYNKDLFDRFGVPYPKENLTWDEVKAIAQRLTRNENGTDFYGLHPGGVTWGGYQLSLPFIDTATDRPMFQAGGWKDVFEMWAKLTVGPDGKPIPRTVSALTAFQKGQIAMTMGYSTVLTTLSKAEGLNWDITTYPINPKSPGVGQRVDSYNLAVTTTSKHKDAAFRVVEVLLSDEVQTELSKNGRYSVLKDQKILDQFGQGVPEIRQKNVAALAKLKLTVVMPFKYSFTTLPSTIITQAYNEMFYDGKDVNTVLREADEKLSNEIKNVVK